MNNPEKTIAIVGGGITGMAAAHAAQTLLPGCKIVLLESNNRLGGVLQTESIDGYLVEQSADMFTTDPPFAMQLCDQLGKTDELIETTPTTDRAFVASGQSIHPVPRGLSLMLPSDLASILESPILDDQAKSRFVAERDVPARNSDDDESLESFAIRRFGQSAFENLIQPLVGGIYTADPAKLSMQATMARFVKMEKQHGSLIRAGEAAKDQVAEREASGARYGLFRAPRQGMGQLVQWIEQALTNVEIRTDCLVKSLSKSNSGWAIKLKQNGSTEEPILADGVVLATPARVSAELLKPMNDALAQQLARIEAASSAIVVLGVDQSQLREAFAGYGIIVPSVLNRQVIATSFSSNKFAGRAPQGKVLIRCFIGGALQSELVDLADDQLVGIATKELEATVGFAGTPDLSRVYCWRNCMPQYHLGHLDRVNQIDSLIALHSGLTLAGNSYRGVGIPACIQSGTEAIEKLVRCFAEG